MFHMATFYDVNSTFFLDHKQKLGSIKHHNWLNQKLDMET